jgi:hypothetical protein
MTLSFSDFRFLDPDGSRAAPPAPNDTQERAQSCERCARFFRPPSKVLQTVTVFASCQSRGHLKRYKALNPKGF